MSSRQGRECGPGLSAWWNVLPFFFANYALRRRDIARCVLGAAGSANERFHITVPGFWFRRRLIGAARDAKYGTPGDSDGSANFDDANSTIGRNV
jgi:hypothetical protein